LNNASISFLIYFEVVLSLNLKLNLISTLTFLLETENLSRVEMLLQHQKDTLRD